MHGGTWRFLLQSDGKVGIGTISPSALLEVAGNLKLSNGGKLLFPDGTSLATANPTSGISSNDPAIQVTSSGSTVQLSLTNSGITTAKLADGSVTVSKLAPGIPPTAIAGVAATLGANSFSGTQTVQGTVAISDQLQVQNTSLLSRVVSSTNNAVDFALTARNTATTDSAVAVRAETSSPNGTAISALTLSTSGNAVAVNGKSNSPQGAGVFGESSSNTGLNFGVRGISRSTQGVGVQGDALATTGGASYGVVGTTAGDNYSAGVYAQANSTYTVFPSYGLLARNQSSTGIAVFGHETSTTGSTYGLYAKVDSPNGVAGMFMTSAPTGSVLVANNSSRRIFRVDTTGNVYALGSFNPGGADYAEAVQVQGPRESYHPGDVLVIDESADRRFQLSQVAYSTNVAGVFSTKPGIVGSAHPMEDIVGDEIPLAMVGIVPCRVSAENGPIHRGDLLVTSSLPGHAMRGTDPGRMTGAIVGKSLGTLETGTGTIEILVTLQ